MPQLPPPIKLTVEELINFAIHSSNISKKSVVEFCLKMDLDLNEHMKKVFFKLSGGNETETFNSYCNCKNPEIFIFDEPTANLDPKGRENFMKL